MCHDLLRLDLCHIEVSGAERQVSMQSGANWVPIFASIGTCQRAPDCQRLSAAMALTVCPVHLPVTESDRPACRGLDMRKVWKSATYKMDATPGASKPMSAASAHFEPTVRIGSSN